MKRYNFQLGYKLIIGIPYFWLLLFFLIPFLIIFKISLSDYATAQPPYTPTISIDDSSKEIISSISQFDLENYQLLIEDDLYWKSYLSSIKIAFIATIFTFIIAYPISYAIARAPPSYQTILLLLVIVPFWTSFLVRIYAWIGILKNDGFLNQLLMWVGLIDKPIIILNTDIAIYIGIIYSYLPYMILPIYASLGQINNSLLEAAIDMGCTKSKAFFLVTLPLSMPGVVAGCFLVFIPAIGEFVIPDLLGGSNTNMIGKTIWIEFFGNRDWSIASAIATVLLMLLIFPIILFSRRQYQGKY